MSTTQLSTDQVEDRLENRLESELPNEKRFQTFWTGERFGLPLVAVAFACLIPIWYYFEHRLPSIDESGHILNSFAYADLFRHPRLLSGHWWHELLTVNRFYPPLVHMLNGFLKSFMGTGRWIDIASLTGFNLLLTASTYGITRNLTRSSKAALFAAIFINFYPELALLNRAFWLDFPLTAMVGVALYALTKWQSTPNWKSAAWAGVALGLACMTKQIAATYLALPFAAVAIVQVVRKKLPAPQVLMIVTLGALICAPWFLLNAGAVKEIADECAVHIMHRQTILDNLKFYASVLPSMMSPLLMACFAGALFATPRTEIRRLWPLALSALGGIAAVSTLAWIIPKPQYIAPALIGAAVLSGCFAEHIVESRLKLPRIAVYLVIIVAGLQIASLLFAPYPVSQPVWFAKLPEVLGNTIKEPRLGINRINARPAEDWGQYWSIKQIDQIEKGKPVWLNVLCNSPDLNVHTFEIVARDLHSPVKPTTSRVYTIGGDETNFSEEKALYYQWYLIQSENRYQGFADAKSESEFNKLKQFVRSGKNFKEVARKALPDDSTIFLYKQL